MSSRQQQYLADYWQDNEATTLVSNEEVILQHPQQQKKKKKSRGNRQLQRFRAKLTKQEELSSKNKRKREKLLKPDGVTTSASGLSLMQPSMKRTRIVPSSSSSSSSSSSKKNKPDYLHMNDEIFKRELFNALKGIEQGRVLTLLDTPEKLREVRTYAQWMNDFFYLKMKDDFWKYYMSLITSAEFISSSQSLSKSICKHHHIHRIQFVKQENILKQQQIVTERLQQIERQLNEYKEPLSTMIPAFVRRGQRKLTADFERKKLLLKYDIADYYLVYTFYNLNPTVDQIMSTKLIWQTTMNQQKNEEYLAILKQRIYTKRLPTSLNLVDHSIDPHTQQMLRDQRLPTHERVTLSSQREKTIARFKQDLLTIEISTIEKLIQSQSNLIADEKKKLTESTQDSKIPPLPKSLVDILHAIAARQSNIIKRAQLHIKHKLSFFEYAPAIIHDVEKQIVGANTI